MRTYMKLCSNACMQRPLLCDSIKPSVTQSRVLVLLLDDGNAERFPALMCRQVLLSVCAYAFKTKVCVAWRFYTAVYLVYCLHYFIGSCFFAIDITTC